MVNETYKEIPKSLTESMFAGEVAGIVADYLHDKMHTLEMLDKIVQSARKWYFEVPRKIEADGRRHESEG